MFFEEDPINDFLKCPLCDEKLDEPVFIPCGEHVCESCIKRYVHEHSDQHNDQFKCFICDEWHARPKNGFPKSKRMKLLLDIKPKNVNKGEIVEKFKQDLERCKKEIDQIKHSLSNKEEIVKDFFAQKRHEIHVAKESRIQEINNRSIELLNEIDQLEKEHLENLRSNEDKQLEADLKQAEEFCDKWIEKLKLPATSEEDVKKERDELDSLVLQVKESEFIKNDFIFNSQRINFIENQQNTESTRLLGKLDVTHFKDGAIQTRELSNLPFSVNTHDHLLKDVNLFSNGHICVTLVHNYSFMLTKEEFDEESTECNLLFSVLDSNANLLHSFDSEEPYQAESLKNASTHSHSHGPHVLIATFMAESDTQHLAIISNDPPLIFEHELETTVECKTCMNSKHVYVFNSDVNRIDIFDLKMKKVKSIKIDINDIFGENVSFKVSDDDNLLYACYEDRIEHFELNEMKLIRSFDIDVDNDDDQISIHFTDSYFVLRYGGYLRFCHLGRAKAFSRAVTEPDLSDLFVQIRIVNENRVIFFNPLDDKYFISV